MVIFQSWRPAKAPSYPPPPMTFISSSSTGHNLQLSVIQGDHISLLVKTLTWMDEKHTVVVLCFQQKSFLTRLCSLVACPSKNSPCLCIFFFRLPANLHVFPSQCLVYRLSPNHTETPREPLSSEGKSKLMGTNLHQCALFLSHQHALGSSRVSWADMWCLWGMQPKALLNDDTHVDRKSK